MFNRRVGDKGLLLICWLCLLCSIDGKATAWGMRGVEPVDKLEDEGIVADISCDRGGVFGKLPESTEVVGDEISRCGGIAPDCVEPVDDDTACLDKG